jgi:tetratricopeptide (TPR) repeat protein
LADAVLRVYYSRGEALDKVVGYQESLENFQAMARLASALGRDEQRLRAQAETGYRLTLLGRLDESLAVHQALARELQASSYEAARNRNEQCLAIVLRLLGRYEESLAAHDRSGDATCDEGTRYHTWLNSRGHTLWRMGRYQEAIECFQKVLSWAAHDSQIVHQATAHNNLGLVYSDMEILERAREHHQESLRLRTIIHDSGAICSSYLNLGNVMVQSGDSHTGKDLWARALDISRRLGDAATEAMIENNMGEVCYNSGEYHRALAHFNKSLGMKESLNLLSYLDTSLEGLVKTHYELRSEPGNREKCRLYGERLLKLEAARPQKKKTAREILAALDQAVP